jgi:hypothetical protein
MNYKTIAALAGAILVLALGAYALATIGNVPYDAYSSLAGECKANQSAILAQAAEASDKAANLERVVTDCQRSLYSSQALYAQEKTYCDVLRSEHSVYANAVEAANLTVRYDVLKTYYLDAFGPGKIPSSTKISKINNQIALIGDSALPGLWNAILNCGSPTDCDLAKAAFLSHIDGKIQSISVQVKNIVLQK